jgi:hypothetical protein
MRSLNLNFSNIDIIYLLYFIRRDNYYTGKTFLILMTSPARLWSGGLPVAVVTLLMKCPFKIYNMPLVPLLVAFLAFPVAFVLKVSLAVMAFTALSDVILGMGFMIE